LGNKLVGILDGCLRSRTLYNEAVAWGSQAERDQTERQTQRKWPETWEHTFVLELSA
jgi:hypothetical protein